MLELLNDTVIIAQLTIALFIAIVFVQSGWDKVGDRAGNLLWLKDHFKHTFLSGYVSNMLMVITVLEILSGILALFGIIFLLLFDSSSWIRYSLILSIVTLLMLLFGQRIAKDYEGAKTIVIYLATCLLGLLFF